MTELLSPAGGREALVAAVQNGADAVYMGFGSFNARRSARNFSDEEFLAAVRYCHLRGVKEYLTLNTLVTDREMPSAAEYIAAAARAGVDAGNVFPHNLRHLFATAFYRAYKDIVKLADVLGHSSIETTRIYLVTSMAEHRRQLEQLKLVS